jgi:hypothetical protein
VWLDMCYLISTKFEIFGVGIVLAACLSHGILHVKICIESITVNFQQACYSSCETFAFGFPYLRRCHHDMLLTRRHGTTHLTSLLQQCHQYCLFLSFLTPSIV